MIDKDNIAEPSQSHLTWKNLQILPLTLLQGTRGMKLANKLFLPKAAVESDDAYKVRLENSTLLNAYRKTCSYLAGQVFQADVVFSDEVPDIFVEYADDIDGHKNSLNVFAKHIFYEGISKGVSHILVDAPERSPDAVTVEQEQALGIRPYFRAVSPDDLIGWQITENVISQIRIKESIMLPFGKYGEKRVSRIRLFTNNGEWEVHEKDDDNSYKLIKDGKLSVNELPLATYIPGEPYTVLTGETPLLDLAELNLHHWRSYSDQVNILHVGRVPILFGKNVDLSKMVAAASVMLTSDEDNADMKFVEITGQAIDAGQRDLTEVEAKMALYGLQQLIPRTGNLTATEKALSSSESHSSLSTWAVEFESCLQYAFELMGKYINVDFPPDGVSVNKEYTLGVAEAGELTALLNAVDKGVLSAHACFTEFRRRGIVDEHLTWDEISAEIENTERESIANLSGTFFGTEEQ